MTVVQTDGKVWWVGRRPGAIATYSVTFEAPGSTVVRPIS